MLKGIPNVIGPELLKILDEMGHGDEIVLADSNFPGVTCAKRLVRADGIGGEEMLQAVMRLFPLDTVAKENCFVMAVGEGESRPPIWDRYNRVIDDAEPSRVSAEIERYAFYERAKQAFAVVQTGETALYANIILKKGTL